MAEIHQRKQNKQIETSSMKTSFADVSNTNSLLQAMYASGQILGHDSAVDSVDAHLLERIAETDQVIVAVQLPAMRQTARPREYRRDRIGAGRVALRTGIVTSHWRQCDLAVALCAPAPFRALTVASNPGEGEALAEWRRLNTTGG